MSGEELGKGAGEWGKDASKASVSDWEHERHYPKADQLRVICMKLDVSPEHLLFGKRRDYETNIYRMREMVRTMTEQEREAFFNSKPIDIDEADVDAAMKADEEAGVVRLYFVTKRAPAKKASKKD